jgi:N-acetylmuramoyl-L-alanine amidase
MVKIMLDAGHSYTTPGKGVPTMKEYEFNSAVAHYTGVFLNQYQNVETFISYDDKRDVPLKERTDRANQLKVDVFISIHADAFANPEANGETVFIYTKTGQSTVNLANTINNYLKAEMSISNRGIKRADFHVLRETAMDAVLIEFGFMTNPEDLALLKSDTYRKKCAEMVGSALVEHFGLVKKPEPKPAPQPTPIQQINGLYKVQVGAFSAKDNADRLAAELKGKGYPVIVVKE